jgi:ATP-dependent 26S proteasome regulatory subunit
MWQQLETAGAGQDGENISDLVTVVEPDHRHDLNRMILYPECRTEIQVGLNRIIRAEAMEATWALSQIEPRANRCVLNFYGAPGTGKTLAAVAVAKMLGKKLLKVDYAEIVSKYPGDTAKHIKMVFKIARESNAALMFDEADSLLSRRLNFSDSVDGASVTSINQNRNTLLSQVDEFDGVVIMCTNFFSNYDEAFLRRIARHVEFKLPNNTMRGELFKLHLPRTDKVTLTPDQWTAISGQTTDFSGGDILNVVVNALTRASLPEDAASWELTYQDLSAEVDSVKRAKTRHGRNGG